MRIRQVTARVFCQFGGQGGNPVTIFAAPTRLAGNRQAELAQGCEWESVMVDTSTRTLQFYMPTGEQVSFCAFGIAFHWRINPADWLLDNY